MKSRMIKFGVAAALVMAAIATASIQAAQNRKLDFTLVNKTGLTIMELYVSPTADDEWGDDVLGRDVLKHNEKVDIVFSRSEKDCTWDMKIVDEDDDDVIWTKLDLCTANEITLLYEGKKPTAIIK